jgi:hypothetical protein
MLGYVERKNLIYLGGLIMIRNLTCLGIIIAWLGFALPVFSCCGSQTSLAWLANISCCGLRLVDTIRTYGLTFAANQLKFMVMGSQTAVEGSSLLPMTIGPLSGRQTFYSTPLVVSWPTMTSL